VCFVCTNLLSGSISTYDASLLAVGQQPSHGAEIQQLIRAIAEAAQHEPEPEMEPKIDNSWIDEENKTQLGLNPYSETAMIFEQYLKASFPFGRAIPDLGDNLKDIKNLLTTGITSSRIEATQVNPSQSGLPLYYLPLEKYGVIVSSVAISIFDRTVVDFAPVIYWSQTAPSTIWSADHWPESAAPQLIESIVENLELALLKILKNF
jgi:hypothetical protein